MLMIFGLILSALIARNGNLLLLAFPFIVFLMIGILQSPPEMMLHASRTIDKPIVSAQEQIEIRIVIKNQGISLMNLCL